MTQYNIGVPHPPGGGDEGGRIGGGEYVNYLETEHGCAIYFNVANSVSVWGVIATVGSMVIEEVMVSIREKPGWVVGGGSSGYKGTLWSIRQGTDGRGGRIT